MPSDWQNLSIPFVGGIDTKTDSKLVMPTRLSELENGVFTKHGSLKKRRGNLVTRPVDIDGNDIGSSLGLAVRNDELLLAAQGHLYSYGSATDSWIEAGPCQHVAVSQDTVAATHTAQTFAEVLTYDGVTVAAWEDSRGGVRLSAYDEATGAAYVLDTSIDADGQAPSVVPVAGSILVLWYNTSSDDIKGIRVRVSDVAASVAETPTVVRSDAGSTGIWGVVSDDDWAYLAYHSDGTAALAQVRLARIAPDLTTDQVVDVTVETTVKAVNVAVGPEYVYVAYVIERGANHVAIVNTYQPNLGVVQGSFDLSTTASVIGRIAVGIKDDDTAIVYYEVEAADTYNHFVSWSTYNPVGPAGTFIGNLKHSRLATAAWAQGDFVHVGIVHQSTLQSTYFLLRDDEHLYGRLNEGLAGTPYTVARLPNVHSLGGEVFEVALRTKRRLPIDPNQPGAQYTHDNFKRTLLDYDAPTAFQAVQSGGATYFSGGALWQYDGSLPVESGFWLFPENVSYALNTGGTPAIPDGTYGYRVYWEWTNDAGEREKSSAVGFSVVNATGANRRVVLTIPTLAHTLKKGSRTDVTAVVYRTQSLGTNYFRVSSPDPTTAGAENGWIENDPTADTVTFIDNYTDAEAGVFETDYQNAGEFDNIAPPACSVLASSATRLFLAGGGIPDNTVIYSKRRGLGQPAGEFNGNLTISVPDAGGAITALAEMNGALIIFKRDRIYALAGEGPNDVGGGQFYGTPQLVSSDVGCSKPRTVVLTPAGLMFVSERGIYLYNGSAVQYVGAEVERFNDQDYVSAAVMPDQSVVVFVTSSGSTLSFNYEFGQWSPWTNNDGIDCVMWGSVYCHLKSDGRLFRQNPDETQATDGGVFFSLYWRTGPVRPPGVGIQELWRLRRIELVGEYLSSHSGELGLLYNRDESPSETVVWNPDDVLNITTWGDSSETWGESGTYWGGLGDRDYCFELRVARQKCSTVRFEYRDIPGTSSGASYELTELALQWAPKTGLGRQPATRKV